MMSIGRGVLRRFDLTGRSYGQLFQRLIASQSKFDPIFCDLFFSGLFLWDWATSMASALAIKGSDCAASREGKHEMERATQIAPSRTYRQSSTLYVQVAGGTSRGHGAPLDIR